MIAGAHNVKMDFNKYILGFQKIINNFMSVEKKIDNFILYLRDISNNFM